MVPLGERKAKLAKLLRRKIGGIVFNGHSDEDGATAFQHTCKLRLEGIVSTPQGPVRRVRSARIVITIEKAVGIAAGGDNPQQVDRRDDDQDRFQGRKHPRHAQLPQGHQVSKAQMKCLDIVGEQFHPEWNYTVSPRPP
jgi:hypothetical protein